MILSSVQCSEIISWREIYGSANVRYSPATGSSQGLHKSKLDYNITEVPRDKNTQWFFNFIHSFLLKDFPHNKLNKGAFFYLHEFFTGGKFTKHRDKDRNRDWKVIVGATLNSDYTGGELITFHPDMILAKNIGELYIMNSETIHEVTEVTEGTRFSFVYFISNDELGLSKSNI